MQKQLKLNFRDKTYQTDKKGHKKSPGQGQGFYGKSIKYYSETTSTAIVTTTSLCKLTIAS
jgi:hypothetical protein